MSHLHCAIVVVVVSTSSTRFDSGGKKQHFNDSPALGSLHMQFRCGQAWHLHLKKQKYPHARRQHLGHLWNLYLAISKLNLCPSSVYGSPGTLHSGSLLHTASAEMDDTRVWLLHSRAVRRGKKKTHKTRALPFQTNTDHLLTNSDHIWPHRTLPPCMWFPQINTVHSGIDPERLKQDSHMRERERDGFHTPSLTSSICDQTMYLKKMTILRLTVSRKSLSWPSPALPRKSPAAKPASGTETLLVLGLHHPCAQNVRLDKCTSLFGPKRGQKKSFFDNLFFFYTVNFVSFACCDFNCLKDKRRG